MNGKKKIAVGGVVNLNIPEQTKQQQADWNQNDESAPDFIKNRICSESYGNIFGQVFTINEQGWIGDANKLFLNPITPIFVNETYTARIGDTELSFTTSGYTWSCGGSASMQAGGFGLGWKFDGLSDAPNKETTQLSFACDPSVYAGQTFEILGPIAHTIDDRNISFNMIRADYFAKVLGGVQFQIVGTDLQVSFDNGLTWKTVTLA